MKVIVPGFDLKQTLTKVLVSSMILQPFAYRQTAYANSAESAEKVKVSPEEALDKYSLALYETLVTFERNTVKPEELTVIRKFRSDVQNRMRAANYDPYALRKDFQSHQEELSSIGAQGCMEIEVGLAQIAGYATKYMTEDKQYETLE